MGSPIFRNPHQNDAAPNYAAPAAFPRRVEGDHIRLGPHGPQQRNGALPLGTFLAGTDDRPTKLLARGRERERERNK